MPLTTASVVVPATGLVTERLWPVKALTRLDLPALRTPKKPILRRSAPGVSLRLMRPLLRI